MSHPQSTREPDYQDSLQRFPIRVLAQRTGLSTSTLRAWERRYGLLRPQRTPKGHRLYGENEIAWVTQVLALLADGHSLPAIAARRNGTGSDTLLAMPQGDIWQRYQEQILRAIEQFSAPRIESTYNEATALYPIDLVTERLIEPILLELGSHWSQRAAGIAEEHFFSNWLRNRLGALFHHASSQVTGKRILATTLPGCSHEIGLMLFALAAMSRGYQVLYLGTDLPLRQIPAAVAQGGVGAVILSARQAINQEMEHRIAMLCTDTPTPVLLGGLASDTALLQFEAAGGIRLGSKIPIGLKILLSTVPAI